MSGELQPFNLGELNFDWDSPGIFRRLLQLQMDPETKRKLVEMRSCLGNYHSPTGYTKVLAEIASLNGLESDTLTGASDNTR